MTIKRIAVFAGSGLAIVGFLIGLIATTTALLSANIGGWMQVALGGIAALGFLLSGSSAFLAIKFDKHILIPVVESARALEQVGKGETEVSLADAAREDEIGRLAKASELFGEISQSLGAANRRRTTAVNAIMAGLERMAEGDLTCQIDDSEVTPASEDLRQAFNSTVIKLAAMINSVTDAANSVGTGANEIRLGADDLSQRSEKQVQILQESTTDLANITRLIKETESNTSDSGKAVDRAFSEANDGGVVVGKAVKAMSAIEKSTQEITKVIDLIDGIAFQTNLLALNAGVEAARAGEAGRGFAVVANEVRALAQRCTEAASEIKTLVHSSSGKVEEGVSLVNETGEILETIVGRMGDVNGQINAVVKSVSSQSKRLASINATFQTIEQMTHQNVAMAEQSTAAATSLADESIELARLVAQFQVSQEQSGAEENSKEAASIPQPALNPPTRLAPAHHGNLALQSNDEDWSEF